MNLMYFLFKIYDNYKQYRFVKKSETHKYKLAKTVMKNKNNFEEQFNQPSIQESQKDYDPLIDDEGGPGRAIQLIRIKPSGRIEVDQEALEIICRYSLPIGFCCVAGKYRTGKSFLLNKLLKLQGAGFRVDPSTHACTEGIWMWSKPLLNQGEQSYIFFIDTQGSASTTKDVNNDAKIFTFANLISSYLIYNSVGCIDEKSISELNVVTQLSKNIIFEQQKDLKSNQDILYRFMPKFLWLLRDFTLEPTDKNGRRMNPPEYLEDSLTQQNLASKSDQNTKKIRRALLKYYVSRDCVTLVRPAGQQRDIQNLNQIPDQALRRDFIQGVNLLRQKILNSCGPKMFNDKPLYGDQIASMIESYINTMNNGGIPSISTAWQQVNEDEGRNAFNSAIDTHHKLYKTHFEVEEPKGEQIYSILRLISDKTMEDFRKNIDQPCPFYEQKLRSHIQESQAKIIQQNKRQNQRRNVMLIKEVMSPIVQNFQAKAYDGNPEKMRDQIKQATDKYNKRAKGQNKGELLSEFLAAVNMLILSSPKSSTNAGQQDYLDKVIDNKDKQIEILKKQIDSMKNQAKVPTPPSKIQKPKIDPKAGNKPPLTQKKVKGCCGNQKCSIM